MLDQVEMLSLDAQTGDICIRYDLEAQDEPSVYILKGSDPSQLSHWQLLPVPADNVLSVNSKTGIVELTQDDIGSGVYNKVFTGTEDKVIECPLRNGFIRKCKRFVCRQIP